MNPTAFKVIGTSVIVAGLMAFAFLAGGMTGEKSSANPAPTATAEVNQSAEDQANDDSNLVVDQQDEQDEQDDDSAPSGPSQPAPQQPAPQQPAPQQPAPPAPVEPTPAPPAPVNEAPYIVSITPADASLGAKANVNVVVTFSESMDKADVQAAFEISHGNPGTFSWNGDATVMTFNPGADFAYGTTVIVKISKTAADLEGKGMANDFGSKFRVLVQTTKVIYSDAARDGHIIAPGVLVLGSHVKPDYDYLYTGTWYRGFLSFDLSDLPENLDSIQTAELKVYQSDHHPGAYGPDTGNLMIQSVPFGGTLDAGDFDMAALAFCNVLCLLPAPTQATLSSSAADGWKNANVIGPVRSDWTHRAERGDRSQFRLRFQTENNGAGPSVWAKFTSGNAGAQRPLLTITYLAP